MQNGETASPELAYPSLLIHADDHLAPTTDIAPTLHPSTTYHYPINPDDWRPAADGEERPDEPVYSRVSYSTTERVEKVLGELMGGIFHKKRRLTIGYALTYSSGLSAIHALFVHINPKKVCISAEAGYHGTKGVANIFKRLNNMVYSIHFKLMIGSSPPRTTFRIILRRSFMA